MTQGQLSFSLSLSTRERERDVYTRHLISDFEMLIDYCEVSTFLMIYTSESGDWRVVHSSSRNLLSRTND